MNMREDLYRLYSKIDSESIKLDALQVCYLQQVLKIKLHTCYMARSLDSLGLLHHSRYSVPSVAISFGHITRKVLDLDGAPIFLYHVFY